MNKNLSQSPKLFIKMTGPRVGTAKLSVSDLAEIIKRTQQALKRIGQVLYGQESHGKGRKKKDIEKECELFLVGWEEGSAIAALELGPQPDQRHLLGFIGEESMKALITGMEVMSAGSYDQDRPPHGYDVGVLEAFESLGKIFDHGIETVGFSNDRRTFPKEYEYTPMIRERVRSYLGRPADVGHSTKVGRLEVLNGHGGLRGTFWEANGTKWICLFRIEHLEVLPDAWMHKVKIAGRTIEEEGKEKQLEVDSIFVIEDELGEEIETGEGGSFWQSVSLEELAEVQGVAPVSAPEEVFALWPADDDPDDLLNFVLHDRGARRKLSAGGNA